MQRNTMPVTLTTFNGENRLDSRLIADLLGVKRKQVYRMARHYQADLQRFGIIRFETGDIQGQQGPEKCALLNREQVDRLLTYFDNNPAIQAAATRLLQAFDPAMPDFAKRTPDPVSTTALVPFSFDSREIRFIPREDSFSVVAKDIAEALEYVWAGSATIKHVPDEWRGVNSVLTPSGIQEMATLTEQGLYFFVNRSDKPKALPLQKWVAGEVLPSIRRTGTYTLPGAVPPAVERPLTAALRTSINRRAWRLAQDSYDAWRDAMLDAARFDPAFKPEQWNPVEGLPMPQPEPPDLADMARQLAMASPFRSRNPQRDYEVLQLRLDGMNYREIGLEVGISGTHAWRIVNRQMGMAGAL
jgi:prophage antirepressor-like protein